jgi:hypothetical protein
MIKYISRATLSQPFCDVTRIDVTPLLVLCLVHATPRRSANLKERRKRVREGKKATFWIVNLQILHPIQSHVHEASAHYHPSLPASLLLRDKSRSLWAEGHHQILRSRMLCSNHPTFMTPGMGLASGTRAHSYRVILLNRQPSTIHCVQNFPGR